MWYVQCGMIKRKLFLSIILKCVHYLCLIGVVLNAPRKKEIKELRASKWKNIKSRVQGECDKEKEIMSGDSKEYESKYRNCYILGQKVLSYYHKSEGVREGIHR